MLAPAHSTSIATAGASQRGPDARLRRVTDRPCGASKFSNRHRRAATRSSRSGQPSTRYAGNRPTNGMRICDAGGSGHEQVVTGGSVDRTGPDRSRRVGFASVGRVFSVVLLGGDGRRAAWSLGGRSDVRYPVRMHADAGGLPHPAPPSRRQSRSVTTARTCGYAPGPTRTEPLTEALGLETVM